MKSALCQDPPSRSVRLHRWANPDEAPETVLADLGQPVPWTTSGYYIPTDSKLGKTLWHDIGAFYIQEASAMAVAEALAPEPDALVLDLCAAPGGKSTHLGKLLGASGWLVANEIHPQRVVVLAQNLERLGVPATVLNESPARIAEALGPVFDAVLVDAPCSGEGMFRKHPAAATEWTEQSPEECAARQRDILTQAVHLTRPGGTIVYSTCTLNPVENEQVVSWALSHLPVTLDPLPDWAGWSPGRPEWADDTNELAKTRRLWPHLAKAEGHFVARFRVLDSSGHGGTRTQSDEAVRATYRERGSSTGPTKGNRTTRAKGNATSTSEWLALAHDLFEDADVWFEQSRNALGDPLVQSDVLFSRPPLDFGRLRVLRPGLPLATNNGKRLMPHHALAMALPTLLTKSGALGRFRDAPEADNYDSSGTGPDPRVPQLRQVVQLSPTDAASYLAGQALTPQMDHPPGKGWVLMQTSGLPLGWGKAAPGRINNALPRGLRQPHVLL